MMALSSNVSAFQVNTEYRGFRRVMPGGTRAEIEAAEAMGFQAFLAQQLSLVGLDDVEGLVSGGPDGVDDYWASVNLQPLEINTGPQSVGQLESEANMRYARLWRWVYSEQGLYETMTWEWDRHFNVNQSKRGWDLYPYWNRVVTRKHAFGQFRDMLHASAGDNADRASAMLVYLDNLKNRCMSSTDPVNENFGRERIELHGLGTEDQQFTEDDVRNMSLFGSGREIDLTPNSTDYGMVRFVPAYHCAVTRPFLGVTFPGDPLTGSQQTAAVNWMVDYQTPAGVQTCAEFIAKKLVKALLTDAEVNAAQQLILDGAVVDAVNAFGPDGDIKAMTQAILTDANIDGLLAGGSPAYKYMEPTKFVTSLLRASEAALDEMNMESISEVLTGLAERPYAYSPPIGYPTEIEAWVQDQAGRWEFAYSLFEENTTTPGVSHCTIDGVSVDVDALYNQLTPPGFDVFNCGAQVDEILTAGNLDSRDALIIQLYADRVRTNGWYTNDQIKWRVLALGAMAPSFSRY